jgi:hypothetical protein
MPTIMTGMGQPLHLTHRTYVTLSGFMKSDAAIMDIVPA